MQRVLALEGANNFRDMGGYQAGDKTVKWGMLYRSDHFAALTDADLEKLKELGINTIFDFRSDGERARYPDRLQVPNVVKLDPSSKTAEDAAQAALGSEKLEDENKRLVKMAEGFDDDAFLPENNPIRQMYVTFVTDAAAIAAYKKMIELLPLPGTPASVMHCRGGKDRTGYGAALVLYLLGVSMDDIVEDFMLTGKLREKRNAFKMGQYRALTDDERILDYLYSFIDTRPEFILSSFEEMARISGDVDSYFREYMGISDDVKQSLRAMYLEQEE